MYDLEAPTASLFAILISSACRCNSRASSIAPRLITEETIHNKPVFNHLLNNLSDKNIEYDYDEDEEEEEEDIDE